jgi:hypothetical protein
MTNPVFGVEDSSRTSFGRQPMTTIPPADGMVSRRQVVSVVVADSARVVEDDPIGAVVEVVAGVVVVDVPGTVVVAPSPD